MKAIAVLLVALLFAAPILAQSGICAECQKVVAWLENEISANSTLAELEATLQTFCALMPASEQGTCQSIVTKYLPDAINWILTKASPAEACGAINLCNSSRIAATSAPTTPPTPSDACKVCEIVAAGAELYIDSHPNDTAAEVTAELIKLCNSSFLAKYKFECEFLVSSEGNGIITALFAGKPASQVCASTLPPLCPSTETRSADYHRDFRKANKSHHGHRGPRHMRHRQN